MFFRFPLSAEVDLEEVDLLLEERDFESVLVVGDGVVLEVFEVLVPCCNVGCLLGEDLYPFCVSRLK